MKNPYFVPQPSRFDFSTYLEEVANTLQYCLRVNLQIDSDAVSLSEGSDLLEQLTDYCYERLSSFILGRSGWYSFFGQNPSDLDREERPTNLYRLNHYQKEWKRVFLEDAITETLIYLRDLLSINSLTNYQALAFSHDLHDTASNKQIYHNRIIGLDRQLEYKTAKLKIAGQNIGLNLNKSKIHSQHTSSQCSSYGKMCKEVNADILAFSPKTPELRKTVECSKAQMQIPAGRVDLAAYYVSHRKEVKTLCDIYNKEISNAELLDAMHSLQDDVSKNDLSDVDCLYLYACIERTFHISTILHLYERVKSINNYDLFHDAITGSLSSCLALPLCFSGKLLIDMAFDSIDREPTGKYLFDDFLDINDMMSYGVKPRDPYSLHKWINQYNAMMYYLSDFAFPVFRSCFFVRFFCTMEQRIKSLQPEKRAEHSVPTNTAGPECEVLISMYYELRDYLNRGGYNRLICPDDTKIPVLTKFLDTKDQPSKTGNYNDLVPYFKNVMTSYRKIESKRPQGPFITLQYLDELSYSQPLVDAINDKNSIDPHVTNAIANHFNLYILDAGHFVIDLKYKERL